MGHVAPHLAGAQPTNHPPAPRTRDQWRRAVQAWWTDLLRAESAHRSRAAAASEPDQGLDNTSSPLSPSSCLKASWAPPSPRGSRAKPREPHSEPAPTPPRTAPTRLNPPQTPPSDSIARARASVHVATILGQRAAIKRRQLGGPVDLLRTFLSLGRADQQSRGAARLRAAGLLAPRTLASWSTFSRAESTEWLVLEWMPGPTLLEFVCSSPSPRESHAVADLLGRTTASLLRAGLFNRDHKASNLVLVPSENAADTASCAHRIAFLDTVAVRRARSGDAAQLFAAAWMLKCVYVECLGVGRPVPRTARARTIRSLVSARFGVDTSGKNKELRRRLWDQTARLVRTHGDMRPADNPLPRARPSSPPGCCSDRRVG